jgi:Tfp pilus assembly protein PilF
MGLDHDWQEGEAAFRRALDLNPSDARAHNSYGLFLSYLGRTEEAVEQMGRAQELDPLSPWIAVGVAWPYLYAPAGKRDYRRAIGILEAVVETDRTFVSAHTNLAIAYSLLDRCDLAMKKVDEATALSGGEVGFLVWLGSVQATCGAGDRATEILERAAGDDQPGHVSPFLAALVHAALGDNEAALRWIETAFEERDELLVMAMVEPRLDGLRSDPRFVALMRRMRVPAA